MQFIFHITNRTENTTVTVFFVLRWTVENERTLACYSNTTMIYQNNTSYISNLTQML